MTNLTLAIPSKGRLKEQTEDFFADVGLPIRQIGGARGYAASMPAIPELDVQLRSASEIANGLAAGEFHLGVTGLDLLHEINAPTGDRTHLIAPLGFGHANMVVAVPAGWIDVSVMSDLDDVAARHLKAHGQRLRVATKYMRQTQQFFDRMGVGHYRIVESAGATEGAPASGAAEIIVDITTTGATLAGNGLKIVDDGTILKSQAYLVASTTKHWSEQAKTELKAILQSMEARREARSKSRLTFAPSYKAASEVKHYTGAIEIVAPGDALCDTGLARELASSIVANGGGPVIRSRVDAVFRDEVDPYTDFLRALRS